MRKSILPSVSSSPACEDGSTCPNPAPNVPQNRSCHEKRRTLRVYVIIRDGTRRLDSIFRAFNKNATNYAVTNTDLAA